MGNVNRGKDFEDVIKKAFMNVPGCAIDRVPDQMAGFAGVKTFCDFIAYKYPHILYIECKTSNSNTLPFSNISKNQWEGLIEKSKVPGAIAGVMVWFINLDITAFVPIQSLCYLRDSGAKSLNGKKLLKGDFEYYLVSGRKRKVFFDYNIDKFLEHLYEGVDEDESENL